MDQFIPRETLDILSYRSTLGQSLKQISLRSTPLETILDDIAKYRSDYIDVLIQGNLIGSRFKSEDSIIRKYKKTLQTGGGFKQCFNDVLGFRLRFEEYPEEYPDYFRVVDLRSGKKVDDGYRAIHLYYQRDTWLILLRYSSGAVRTMHLISGVINMCTNIKHPRLEKLCIRSIPLEPFRQNMTF